MSRPIIHGDAKRNKVSRLYNIWANIKKRCLNPNNPRYHRYGSRSICKEWLDYPGFKKWAMGNGYKNGLTIDRVNNNKGYNPSNCQWITKIENTAKGNSETKRKLTFKDATDIRASSLSQSKLAKIYNVGQPRIWNIIHYKTYKKDYSCKM